MVTSSPDALNASKAPGVMYSEPGVNLMAPHPSYGSGSEQILTVPYCACANSCLGALKYPLTLFLSTVNTTTSSSCRSRPV
jgi:hypothetical protein